jgi:uncharacterized protein YkwD
MKYVLLIPALILALGLLPGGVPMSSQSAQAAPWTVDDQPSPEEQYMFELIQRCRANPDGEAAFYGIDLNEGLAAGTLPPGARQPLALNFNLLAAARDHCQDLIDNFPSLPTNHNGSDGRSPKQRMTDAGADTSGWTAENIGWTSKSKKKITSKAMDSMHRTLFVDTVDAGRGHRKTLVFGTLNQGAPGARGGDFAGKSRSICTEDFISSSTLFIVGVAYADFGKDDDFFTPGEELPGLTIRATSQTGGGTYTTTTWRSGGYNLAVPADTYTVTAEGTGLIGTVTRTDVVVGTQNMKVDIMGPDPKTLPPPPRFELVKAKGKLNTSAGLWKFDVKKCNWCPGSATYAGDLSDLMVVIDGDEYFPLADRAMQTVSYSYTDSGAIQKIKIKCVNKNKLTLDLKKQKMSVTLKTAPDFDPSGGSVTIQVDLMGTSATVTATAAISGSKMNKVTLAPTTGVMTVP